MTASAVLAWRGRVLTHHFDDRTLLLDKPVKIGRSQDHDKPDVTNAIFNCKSLSRNHAILFYVDGKFYLEDTMSSNGTAVNRKCLSLNGMRSAPVEVFSGDCLRFGTAIYDFSKKVMHRPVIATLQLYLPNGKEAAARTRSVTLQPYNDKDSTFASNKCDLFNSTELSCSEIISKPIDDTFLPSKLTDLSISPIKSANNDIVKSYSIVSGNIVDLDKTISNN